jgi:hypothetical protein
MAIVPRLPGFAQVDLDRTGIQSPEVGRPYDERSHPKICLHTTEGPTIEGAERAFARFPPHVGVEFRRRLRRQYLPIDRSSFSLRGDENDDEFVVQVEIVGFAASPPGPAECRWLGTEVVAPIARAIGCPLKAAPQGFHGPNEGIVLAVSTSPIRFRSERALREFSGVFGHQHAPAPDTHWDPGAIDIKTILEAARNGDDDMPFTPQQIESLTAKGVSKALSTEGSAARVGVRDVVEKTLVDILETGGHPVRTKLRELAEMGATDALKNHGVTSGGVQ